MSKLAAFLVELSDYELQAFHHFRFNEFLKGSKEKIMQEMDKRGIVPKDLSEHLENERIRALQMQPNLCPKCLSEKFYTVHEIETISYYYASFDEEVDYKTCLVCHYSQERVENANPTGHTSSVGFLWKLINRRK